MQQLLLVGGADQGCGTWTCVLAPQRSSVGKDLYIVILSTVEAVVVICAQYLLASVYFTNTIDLCILIYGAVTPLLNT